MQPLQFNSSEREAHLIWQPSVKCLVSQRGWKHSVSGLTSVEPSTEPCTPGTYRLLLDDVIT